MTVLFGSVVERDGDKPDGVVRIVSRGVHPSIDGVSMLAESEERFHIRDGEWETGELEPGDVTVRLELDGRPVVSWPVSIPAEGRHNLRDLLGVSAPVFDRALWERLDARVKELEAKPEPDLSEYATKQELETLTSQPGVHAAPAIKDITREVKFVDAELRDALIPANPDAWCCLETPLDWRIRLDCPIEILKEAIGSGLFKKQITLQHESFNVGVAHVVGTVSGHQGLLDVYESETFATDATTDLDKHIMISLGDLRESGQLSLSLIATKMYI